MSHFIRIFLTVGLSIVAVLIILVSTEQYGPRARMGVFIAEQMRLALGQDVEVEQYVEASLPQRLQREMIKPWSYGPAFYSMTLPSILGQPISVTQGVISYPVQNYASYSRPVPFPPEDVWCARVKSSDPTLPRVLLIAFHKDIYTASWVVHEMTDPAAVLTAVGCQFSTQ